MKDYYSIRFYLVSDIVYFQYSIYFDVKSKARKSMEDILKEVIKLIKNYKTKSPSEIAKALNIEVIYQALGNLKGLLLLSI